MCIHTCISDIHTSVYTFFFNHHTGNDIFIWAQGPLAVNPRPHGSEHVSSGPQSTPWEPSNVFGEENDTTRAMLGECWQLQVEATLENTVCASHRGDAGTHRDDTHWPRLQVGTMARIHVHEVMSSSVPIIRWIRSPKRIISNQKGISAPF